MDPLVEERLAQARLAFGRDIRRGRQIAGISQQKLAVLSGVSQSVISRLERGRAPRFSLERLLMLHRVLGNALPLGACPHDHHCVWRALTASGQRSHTEPLASGAPFWGRFKSAHPPGADTPPAATGVLTDGFAANPSPAGSHQPASVGFNAMTESPDPVPGLSLAIFPWDD